MSELKPCAWCGAPAELVPDEDGSVYIECDHLPGCIFTSSDTRMWFYGEESFNGSPAKTAYEVAAEAWNSRAGRTCRNAEEDEELGFFTCSLCRETIKLDWCWHCDLDEIKFCPNCGAKVVDE